MNTNYASLFAANLAAVYSENRPEGIPAEVAFLAENREGERPRPCVVFSADGEEWPHPKLQQAEITLELLVRTGDTTPDTAAGWMEKLKTAMLALALSAVPEGARLRWLMTAGEGRTPEEDGWSYTATWGVRFQQLGVS